MVFPILKDSTGAYLLSKPWNWLELDPTYPNNPQTLGKYIRKWRMKQRISQVDLGSEIQVSEIAIVNKGENSMSEVFGKAEKDCP